MKHIALLIMLAALPATAHEARVEGADFTSRGDSWTVSVTLSHEETGWDDYADGWRIEAPDGTILGTRELAHPHANEQPFTRSLGGVQIPGRADKRHDQNPHDHDRLVGHHDHRSPALKSPVTKLRACGARHFLIRRL